MKPENLKIVLAEMVFYPIVGVLHLVVPMITKQEHCPGADIAWKQLHDALVLFEVYVLCQ